MKPQDKATELKEKFGRNSLDIIEETFKVWNIKLNQCKRDNHKIGIEMCLRTLKYWGKVKDLI